MTLSLWSVFDRRGKSVSMSAQIPFSSSIAHRSCGGCFFNGKRYAAIQGRLCELTRPVSSDRVRFSPQAILANVETEIMAALESNLARIQIALESPETEWRLAGGEFLNFQSQLSEWLGIVLASVKIAETPNV